MSDNDLRAARRGRQRAAQFALEQGDAMRKVIAAARSAWITYKAVDHDIANGRPVDDALEKRDAARDMLDSILGVTA